MINTQRIAVRSTTRTQMHTKLPSLDGETDTDAVNDAREDDCSTTGQITWYVLLAWRLLYHSNCSNVGRVSVLQRVGLNSPRECKFDSLLRPNWYPVLNQNSTYVLSYMLATLVIYYIFSLFYFIVSLVASFILNAKIYKHINLSVPHASFCLSIRILWLAICCKINSLQWAIAILKIS